MPLTNLTVAEEALSLSPEDRTALAKLLIQSLETDSRTDAEIKAELNRRLEQLLSKKDEGLAFHEGFRPCVVKAVFSSRFKADLDAGSEGVVSVVSTPARRS